MTRRLFFRLAANGAGRRSFFLCTFFAVKRETYSSDEIQDRIDGLLAHWG